MRVRGRPSFPVLVARLLLLLAALTMPVSASAERADTTHCRMHHGAGAGATTHHDAPAVSKAAGGTDLMHDVSVDLADDEPCPHCPASSCAALTTCSAPTPVNPVRSVVPPIGATSWCAAFDCGTDLTRSLAQEPPTRPPLVVR